MLFEDNDIIKARKFVAKVLSMAKKEGLNCFIVTDGASGITNKGNQAVKHAGYSHIEWEKEKWS